MDCPKCRALLTDDAAECSHCGIIVAKYLEREESVPPPIQNVAPGSGSRTELDPESVRALAQLFIVDTTPSKAAVVGRAIFLVFLAFVTTTLIGGVDAERGSFIDIANLNALGVAHRDHAIASVVQVIGILTMIAALAWGARVVWNQIGMLRRRPTSL